jgi:hypothetical protein
LPGAQAERRRDLIDDEVSNVNEVSEVNRVPKKDAL